VREPSRCRASLLTCVIALVAVIALGSACNDATSTRTPPSSGAGGETVGGQPSVVVPTVPPGPGDWPMHLHDLPKSGSSPDTELHPPLAIGWKFTTAGAIVGGPIVAADTVFVGSRDGRLYALEAGRWGERWRFKAAGELHSSPAYADGVIVFADTKGKLYGIHGATGKKLWDRTLNSVTNSAPVYANGSVWLGMHPSSLVAFARGDGAEVTTSRSRASIGGVAYATANGLLKPEQPVTAATPELPDGPATRSEPVRAGGFTYVGYQDGSLRAFDGAGVQTWATRLPAAIEGVPAIANGKLYVPCADGALYVFVNEAAAPVQPTDREMATVVASEARTYTAPDTSTMARYVLNDGVEVALSERRDGWARVELPNGDPVWLAAGTWAALSDGGRAAPFRENRAAATVQQVISLPTGSEKPLWSPDGSTIAFLLRRDLGGQFWQAQGLWLYDFDARHTQSIAHGRFFNPHLSWSLDSQWVTFERYEGDVPRVEIAGADTPAPKFIAEGTGPSWSPKAHQLCFFQPGADEDQLWRINSNGADAAVLVRLPVEGYLDAYRPTRPAAWTAEGDRIAVGADARHYGDGVGRLIVRASAGESEETVISTPFRQFRGLSWSPDGEKLACVLIGSLGKSSADPLDQRVVVYWPDSSRAPVSTSHALATWVSADHLVYVELPAITGAPSRVWLMNVLTQERTLLLYAAEPVTSLTWVGERGKLCVWSTSDYVRDGKFQPARTRGWLVEIDGLPAD
jgi:outer membrane protein assembly factor BamB